MCHVVKFFWVIGFMSDAMTSRPTSLPKRKPLLDQINRYNSPFFRGTDEFCSSDPSTTALVILNTPIVFASSEESDLELKGVLRELWDSSSYRVCADGGANRLYEATAVSDVCRGNGDSYTPDLITGDLDSLKPHVREFYESKGVSIVRIEDQNLHDLDKALLGVEKWGEAKSCRAARVFIYGAFGGRFDQEMGCMNALYTWGDAFRHQITLFNELTCAFLLPPLPLQNEIRLRFPDGRDPQTMDNGAVVGEGPTCGLVPLGGRCDRVCTTGLKWNLDGELPLHFGGLVSSSNRVMEDLVTVKSSSPLLFTAEIIRRQPATPP